jgi:hypothetical protein
VRLFLAAKQAERDASYWCDALVRRQLRTLKRLAERDWAEESERKAAAPEEMPLPVITVPARTRETIAT